MRDYLVPKVFVSLRYILYGVTMLENIPLQTCPVGPTLNAFSMTLLVLIVILVGIIILLLRKIESQN